jgi:hypothetical protein
LYSANLYIDKSFIILEEFQDASLIGGGVALTPQVHTATRGGF